MKIRRKILSDLESAEIKNRSGDRTLPSWFPARNRLDRPWFYPHLYASIKFSSVLQSLSSPHEHILGLFSFSSCWIKHLPTNFISLLTPITMKSGTLVVIKKCKNCSQKNCGGRVIGNTLFGGYKCQCNSCGAVSSYSETLGSTVLSASIGNDAPTVSWLLNYTWRGFGHKSSIIFLAKW